MTPAIATVLAARSAYQDIIIICTMVSSIAESAFLAANLVMVTNATTVNHQDVLTVLIFATMPIAIQRDVLDLKSFCVPVALMVFISTVVIVTAVTTSTVSVRQLLIVTNVFQVIMIQIHFAQSVFLVNMDSLVN